MEVALNFSAEQGWAKRPATAAEAPVSSAGEYWPTQAQRLWEG